VEETAVGPGGAGVEEGRGRASGDSCPCDVRSRIRAATWSLGSRLQLFYPATLLLRVDRVCYFMVQVIRAASVWSDVSISN
jgi:hypothetical protein